MTANRGINDGFRVYDHNRKLYLHSLTRNNGGGQWTSARDMARTYRHRATAELIADRMGFMCTVVEPDTPAPTSSYRRNGWRKPAGDALADQLAAAFGMEVHHG